MLKAQLLRYTEAVRHHTEAVCDRRKLLLCGDPNQLNGELNQRYDAKLLLSGDQRQRSGGGLVRSGGKYFRKPGRYGQLYQDMS